ncbi:MAG TPA: dioxygenase, partial [Actinospica sp.]|nr:dioxygenase [Actinospica sp.]
MIEQESREGSTAAAGHSAQAAQQAREQELLERVVASFESADDPRHRQVMQALVRHLHAFLREVRLTEDEWQRAI